MKKILLVLCVVAMIGFGLFGVPPMLSAQDTVTVLLGLFFLALLAVGLTMAAVELLDGGE